MVVSKDAVGITPVPLALLCIAVCTINAIQTIAAARVTLLIGETCVTRNELCLAITNALRLVKEEILALEALGACCC